MSKIFCVVGKSGSGKSTIVDDMFKMYGNTKNIEQFNLKLLVYHTTRERRQGESSDEYIFDTEEQFEEYKSQNQIIEYREYTTKNNNTVYYYTLKQDIDLNKNNYIVKASFDQYENYKNYFGEDDVKLIYIYTDPKELLLRTINRANTYKDLLEVCRRFVSDDEQFRDLVIYPNHMIINDIMGDDKFKRLISNNVQPKDTQNNNKPAAYIRKKAYEIIKIIENDLQ